MTEATKMHSLQLLLIAGTGKEDGHRVRNNK